MPAIARSDGEQFAVYTYRELLAFKKPGLLKREIQLLQEDNGDYARFYVQETGDIEAVFSREPGYLLAECAWQHFGSPSDLIYCEVLPGGEVALLVVIRAGSVYLDAEVPVDNLIDEFIPLSSGSNQYDIYLYGDVPLGQQASETVFAFEPEMVKSFTILEEPAFNELPLNEEFMLLPVPQAVAALRLKSFNPIPLVIALVVLVGAGYFIYQQMKPPPPPPPKTVIVNPYQQYEKDLMSPAPQAILENVAQYVRLLYTIPGWQPSTMALNDSTVSVELTSPLQASGDLLLRWVKKHDMQLGIQPPNATLSIPMKLPSRPKPTTIYNLKEVLSTLLDETHLTIPGSRVQLEQPQSQGKFSTSNVTVTFSGIASPVLNLYGRVLKDKPIVIDSFRFNLSEGLISGQIKMKVLGV